MNTTQDIFSAIDSGDRDALARLVGASPRLASERDGDGVPAIVHALYRGRRDLVPVLLSAGQPLDIFEAAAAGQTDRVRQLLREDPGQAQAFTADGFTALHYAAFFGRDEEIATLLLDAGADPNVIARNPMRVAPLHSALAGRDDGLARLLVERDADVNARQEGGFTPLMEAANSGNQEMVGFLLAHGADASLTADDGRTAADMARKSGYEGLAERLK